MIHISSLISLLDDEVELKAIRSQGAGGQNVNKVSSAIHLRFDIDSSSLPVYLKSRLFKLHDQRISNQGVIIIKAQEHRTQEKNKQEAIKRLVVLIRSVLQKKKFRVATKPKFGAIKKRLDKKNKQGKLKNLRGKVKDF